MTIQIIKCDAYIRTCLKVDDIDDDGVYDEQEESLYLLDPQRSYQMIDPKYVRWALLFHGINRINNGAKYDNVTQWMSNLTTNIYELANKKNAITAEKYSEKIKTIIEEQSKLGIDVNPEYIHAYAALLEEANRGDLNFHDRLKVKLSLLNRPNDQSQNNPNIKPVIGFTDDLIKKLYDLNRARIQNRLHMMAQNKDPQFMDYLDEVLSASNDFRYPLLNEYNKAFYLSTYNGNRNTELQNIAQSHTGELVADLGQALPVIPQTGAELIAGLPKTAPAGHQNQDKTVPKTPDQGPVKSKETSTPPSEGTGVTTEAEADSAVAAGQATDNPTPPADNAPTYIETGQTTEDPTPTPQPQEEAAKEPSTPPWQNEALTSMKAIPFLKEIEDRTLMDFFYKDSGLTATSPQVVAKDIKASIHKLRSNLLKLSMLVFSKCQSIINPEEREIEFSENNTMLIQTNIQSDTNLIPEALKPLFNLLVSFTSFLSQIISDAYFYKNQKVPQHTARVEAQKTYKQLFGLNKRLL